MPGLRLHLDAAPKAPGAGAQAARVLPQLLQPQVGPAQNAAHEGQEGGGEIVSAYQGITVRETPDGYEVLSTSGRTYRVSEQSARYGHEYDTEYMAVWGCDCPAGRSNRDCKHVAAVIEYRRRQREEGE